MEIPPIEFGDASYDTLDIVMHTSDTGSIGFTTNQKEQFMTEEYIFQIS